MGPEDLERLRAAVAAYLGEAVAWIAGMLAGLWSGGVALLNLLSLVFITPVVAFYLLRDWDRIVGRIDSWLPRPHAEVIREQLQEIDRRLAGFVRGQAVVAGILALLYAVGLSLVGLDFGLVIGLGAGAISFVPFLGAIAGFVVSLGVALFQFGDDWLRIALVAAIFIAGQALEGNFLTPRLVGQRIGLHPVWLIFGVPGRRRTARLRRRAAGGSGGGGNRRGGALRPRSLHAQRPLSRCRAPGRRRRRGMMGEQTGPRPAQPACPGPPGLSGGAVQSGGGGVDRPLARLAGARPGDLGAGGQRQEPSGGGLVPAVGSARGAWPSHWPRATHTPLSPPAPAVVIEDAEGGLDAGAEEGLFHLYNLLAEGGGHLLLTGRRPPARWPLVLADLGSRLAALPAVAIEAPDEALIAALIVKLFADRQLRVGREVLAFLLPRMERSFAAARRLVAHIDAAALARQRAVTVPLAREVLARLALEGEDT